MRRPELLAKVEKDKNVKKIYKTTELQLSGTLPPNFVYNIQIHK